MEKYKQKSYLRQEYVVNKKSTYEIGDEVGVDAATIWYWLEKHGIDRRDKIEASKRKRRVEYAYYFTDDSGYERCRASDTEGGQVDCFVARLAAVAWFGWDSVVDSEVHHINEIPWDNRKENLKPMNQSDHMDHHFADDMPDPWKHKTKKYQDEELLRELYLDEELSTHDIGDRLDCSGSTIQRYLEKYGIEKRADYEQIKHYSRGEKVN